MNMLNAEPTPIRNDTSESKPNVTRQTTADSNESTQMCHAEETTSELREKTGYVMMLDILGFKEHISKTGLTGFFKFWKELRYQIILTCTILNNDKHSDCVIDTMFLSDTIVICVSRGSYNPDSCENLIEKVSLILDIVYLPSVQKRFFFRGAISFGKFVCDVESNIAMGDAIIEAYEWYSATEWIGVILSPSAKYAVDRLHLGEPLNRKCHEEIDNNFVLYKAPLKSGNSLLTYAYIWFAVSSDNTANGNTLLFILENLTTQSFTTSIVSKYENTLAFVRSVLDVDIDKYRIDASIIIEAIMNFPQQNNS